MNEWIKCNEKMPIDPKSNGVQSEDVLVTDGNMISVGYYESEYFIQDDPDRYPEQTQLYSSAMWYCDNSYIENVTHWMPLPSLDSIEEK